MQRHEFVNTLKKLSFIDKPDWMTDAVWEKFNADPVKFFMRSDDQTGNRLWDMIAPEHTSLRETTE